MCYIMQQTLMKRFRHSRDRPNYNRQNTFDGRNQRHRDFNSYGDGQCSYNYDDPHGSDYRWISSYILYKKTEIAISVFSLEFQSWVLCWVLHVLITMITFTNDFTQSPKNWFLVKNLYNDSKCTYGPLQIWKLTYIVFFQIR